MIKKIITRTVVTTSICILNFSSAQAQITSTENIEQRSQLNMTESVGLGAKLGSFTGVSAKYWSSEIRAWDATLAFDKGNTAFNIDYLWEFRNTVANLTKIDNAEHFVTYIGIGAIAGFGSRSQYFSRDQDNFGFAARIPVGIEFLPKSASLGVFGEIALDLALTPLTNTFFTADIGARYYF